MVFPLEAQNYFDNFGKFNQQELIMSSYNLDNQAEAVVLYDVGRTSFNTTSTGIDFLFERITRIKILTRAGLKYAECGIPYYIDNEGIERVLEIQGNTYNLENGALKISKLDPKHVYEEKINEHWSKKKFAMPDVKEGSVIEYRYHIESPYLFNLRDWQFQHTIPAIYSEYTASMIPFYEYSFIAQGTSKFDVYKNTTGNFKKEYASVQYYDNIYTFGMKNVPAFRDEEYITSINDYIIKMDFQLSVIHYPGGAKKEIITTWPMLCQSMLKLNEFGLYIKAIAKSAGELLPVLSLEGKSGKEKCEKIVQYVKANYSWDGYQSKYANKTAKEFLKTKTGNSASINLFLASMLGEAGMQAYPVLLSTRDHGKIPTDFPFETFLNYVIVLVRIDGQDILLDATEPLSPFGMLPARCINDKGLLVIKDKVEWIPLTDKGVSVQTDSVRITFNAALDSTLMRIQVASDGHKALDLRRKYHNDRSRFLNAYITEGMKPRGEIGIRNATLCDQPFIFDYAAVSGIETIGDKILVTPFPGLAPERNPLKQVFRTYPVDMIYPHTHTFVVWIDIPPGYTYQEQLKNVSVDNPLVSIQYVAENVSGQVKLSGTYSFKKPVYLPHEYYDLKSYFTKIVETFNSKIVFSKVT